MTGMEGNPHYREADRSELDETPFVIAQAILTLAFELRTANLAALYGHGQFSGAENVLDELLNRLGVDRPTAETPAAAPEEPKTAQRVVCRALIDSCVKFADHEPPCRCVLEAGHLGPHQRF